MMAIIDRANHNLPAIFTQICHMFLDRPPPFYTLPPCLSTIETIAKYPAHVVYIAHDTLVFARYTTTLAVVYSSGPYHTTLLHYHFYKAGYLTSNETNVV